MFSLTGLTRPRRLRRYALSLAVAALLAGLTACGHCGGPAGDDSAISDLPPEEVEEVPEGTPFVKRVTGDAGDDRLIATDDYAVLTGGEGDDEIYAAPVESHVFGEAGADVLYAGAGKSRLLGGDGDDILRGSTGLAQLYGEAGADLLYGGYNDDLLDGGAGDDRLVGRAGRSTMVGGEGDDRFVAGLPSSGGSGAPELGSHAIADFGPGDRLVVPLLATRPGGCDAEALARLRDAVNDDGSLYPVELILLGVDLGDAYRPGADPVVVIENGYRLEAADAACPERGELR